MFQMTPGGYANPAVNATVSVDQGTANSQVNGLPTLVVHVHPSGTGVDARGNAHGWVERTSRLIGQQHSQG